MIRLFFCTILVLCIASISQAQIASSERTKTILSSTETLTLDSLSIIPNSLKVSLSNGEFADSTRYEINYVKAQFRWKGAGQEKLTIHYRVMPISLAKRYFRKDSKILQELPIDNRSFYTYTPPSEAQTLFNVKGLNKSGSISRGIMFGNNQNLSVNSGMSLQMTGKIANDIEITAAIADDNLPIQPDGNTQQLSEFDRVFIQLKRDSTSLIAGDYELQRPDSYFMNFYKRSQGAMVKHQFSLKQHWKLSSTAAFAVAKGRSARQQFKGEDGNQGPYRLVGNNAERYIIVLAGTERVFIDGIALVRGQENDYVIDYNTAEITFTAKQIINQNSRISIEFEYSDKNYSRSLSYVNQKIEGNKLALRFNYYNEKDNKNQPVLQNLSDAQKQFLQSIGNQIDQAYFPNVSEVEFNENEILYEKLSDLNNNSYYRYSTNPQTAKYRLSFSYVGAGKGDYQLNNLSGANGKVYEYVAPIGNIKQGDFAPITLLISPKQQQLITLAGDYKFSKNSLVTSEFALSNNNVNLFANPSVANSQGYGLKIGLKHPFMLNTKGLKLNTDVQYEYTDASFKPLERYRSVEFERDFNLNQAFNPSTEQLLNTQLQLYKNEMQNVAYRIQALNRAQQYQGVLQELNGKYKIHKYQLQYRGSLLLNKGVLEQGQFYKHWADLNRELGSFILGLNLDQQRNQSRWKNLDTLTGNSFAYASYKIYLQTQSSQKNQFKLDYTFRQDELPKATQLLRSAEAQSINFSMDLTRNPNHNLSLTAGYRNTQYFNAFVQNTLGENLVGRIDHQLRLLRGFLSSNFHYEVGSGQEPRREITYLEVLPGQGTHAWNDYNQNGIKELNEFELAQFPDQAKFIPIFTSGTNYVRSNFTGINHHIIIQASQLKDSKSALVNWFKKFSNQTSYKIDRKIMAGQGWMIYNPFYTDMDASNLISLNALFRNTLSFNRLNPKFGLDYNFLADGGKSIMSNGFDTRRRQENSLRVRTSPLKRVYLNLLGTQGDKSFQSDLFSQRNYRIHSLELQAELSYQYSSNFQCGLSSTLGELANAAQFGGETNRKFSLASDARYNWVGKGLINGKISLVNHTFVGNSNSAVAYEMLSGLQMGSNYLWTLGLQRNISNGIQLNFNYEGRKSLGANTVHTGNMQIRAYF